MSNSMVTMSVDSDALTSSMCRLRRPALRADDPLTAASHGPAWSLSHSTIHGRRILVHSRYSIGMRAIGLLPPAGFPISTTILYSICQHVSIFVHDCQVLYNIVQYCAIFANICQVLCDIVKYYTTLYNTVQYCMSPSLTLWLSMTV